MISKGSSPAPLPPSWAWSTAAATAPAVRDAGQPRGVLVLEVQEGSPAAEAGLESDDLLLGINQHPVGSVDDVQRLMALSLDPQVKMDVLRKGRRRELSAYIFWRKEHAAA